MRPGAGCSARTSASGSGPAFERGRRPGPLPRSVLEHLAVSGHRDIALAALRRGRARRGRLDGTERPAQALLAERRLEQVADVVHEQRARGRVAVVVGDVPAEHEQLLRARDRRVQQVALGRQRIERLAEQQPRGFREASALVLAEQLRWARAGREHVLLQRAYEQGPDAPRAQRERIEHGDSARPGRVPPNTSTRSSARASAAPSAGTSSGAARASSRNSPSAARPADSARASSSSASSSTLAVARRGAANSHCSSRAARSISAAGRARKPRRAGR